MHLLQYNLYAIRIHLRLSAFRFVSIDIERMENNGAFNFRRLSEQKVQDRARWQSGGGDGDSVTRIVIIYCPDVFFGLLCCIVEFLQLEKIVFPLSPIRIISVTRHLLCTDHHTPERNAQSL